jgi:hypothetical protein
VTETCGVHIGPICGVVTAAAPAGRCRHRSLLNSRFPAPDGSVCI